LPKLAADLEEIRCTLLGRLSAPAPAPAATDELLSVRQAAAKLNCSKVYLYKNDFPFKRKLGRKVLFSSRGIDEYLTGQR
jgi:predicted DNA-binding transcriptional regulator AlpA